MSKMERASLVRYSLALSVAVASAAACDSNEPTSQNPMSTGGVPGSGGSLGGTTAAGSGGVMAGAAGSAPTMGGSSGAPGTGGSSGTDGIGGTAGSGEAGMGGADGGSGGADGDCGDVTGEGVVVYEDVTESTTWSCPRYTLARPTFVRSTGTERTTLTIAPGVTVAGVRGDLDALKLPGALIVTRSARLEAVGRSDAPIVFTSAQPVGSRAPGDWGGVVLLGRATTNVPANLEASGNVAGEMFIEGLPKTELTTYGHPLDGGTGGAGGAGGGSSGNDSDTDWDCGTLEYVRIEFAGFEVAPTRELNGLTMGACGRGTIIDRVQVHLGSDDGIEIFGGAVDLKHVVMTGAKDDSLDWDQGWRGRAQFVAIQMHDDSALAGKGDSGIEADGYADFVARFGAPSSPRISNMTLIASVTSTRGIRLREGTQVTIRNSLILAPTGGVASGLVDLGDAITADWITTGQLSLRNTVFSGAWPVSGQADSLGTLYTEADYFTSGPGAVGNDQIGTPTLVLLGAFNQTAPGWVPSLASIAVTNGVQPMDLPGEPPFFDGTAAYRGAFMPGGEDWTSGWTAYPVN